MLRVEFPRPAALPRGFKPLGFGPPYGLPPKNPFWSATPGTARAKARSQKNSRGLGVATAQLLVARNRWAQKEKRNVPQ
jgi:hypothetical protein